MSGKELDGVNQHVSSSSGKFRFSGKYGKDLMSEVSRYALVAASIAAREQFDIIHAHDWLTYWPEYRPRRSRETPGGAYACH